MGAHEVPESGCGTFDEEAETEEAAAGRQVKAVSHTIVPIKEKHQARALNLGHGKCIRIVAGGKFMRQPGVKYEGKWPPVKKREFFICAVGVSGEAAALQLSTPDVRAPEMPFGADTRMILVGDKRKMCRFGWPLVHYESDLLPKYAKNIEALHGARRR